MAAVAPPRGLPPNASLPTKVTPIAPNQTLYVTNLPSAKIQKPDLRTELYLLFSTYGPVLDIVAMKTMKMRGQAHITYRDIQTATQAMRSLEGFEFLGRPLPRTDVVPTQRIQYAKSKSDFIARLDPNFELPKTGAAKVEVTSLQQSIFNAPAPGTAAKPAPAADTTMEDARSEGGRGQKRTRDQEEEEESDDDGDVAMEEDSD
ncbi:RNA binding domain protein [Verticillium dahliae]